MKISFFFNHNNLNNFFYFNCLKDKFDLSNSKEKNNQNKDKKDTKKQKETSNTNTFSSEESKIDIKSNLRIYIINNIINNNTDIFSI